MHTRNFINRTHKLRLINQFDYRTELKCHDVAWTKANGTGINTNTPFQLHFWYFFEKCSNSVAFEVLICQFGSRLQLSFGAKVSRQISRSIWFGCRFLWISQSRENCVNQLDLARFAANSGWSSLEVLSFFTDNNRQSTSKICTLVSMRHSMILLIRI